MHRNGCKRSWKEGWNNNNIKACIYMYTGYTEEEEASGNCRVSCAWNGEGKRGPRVLHSYNVWNIKVRLTGCLSSNYSVVQLVPARPRGIVFGRRERERERVRGKNVAWPRFTTKRDTCRMYRRLPRNGHNSGGLITIAPGASDHALFFNVID